MHRNLVEFRASAEDAQRSQQATFNTTCYALCEDEATTPSIVQHVKPHEHGVCMHASCIMHHTLLLSLAALDRCSALVSSASLIDAASSFSGCNCQINAINVIMPFDHAISCQQRDHVDNTTLQLLWFLSSITCDAIASHQGNSLWWHVFVSSSHSHPRHALVTQVNHMGSEVNAKKVDSSGEKEARSVHCFRRPATNRCGV